MIKFARKIAVRSKKQKNIDGDFTPYTKSSPNMKDNKYPARKGIEETIARTSEFITEADRQINIVTPHLPLR